LKARVCAPATHVDRHFRGGEVVAATETDLTLRVQLEQHASGLRVVERSRVAPGQAQPNVGDPVVVTVQGAGPADHVVLSVFNGRRLPGVERGPSVLNGTVAGVPSYLEGERWPQ
jgi:hypothetical protein